MSSQLSMIKIINEMDNLNIKIYNNLGDNYKNLYYNVIEKFKHILNHILIKNHSIEEINHNYNGILTIDILKSIDDLENIHIKYLKEHDFDYKIVEEYFNYNGKELNSLIYNNINNIKDINNINRV